MTNKICLQNSQDGTTEKSPQLKPNDQYRILRAHIILEGGGNTQLQIIHQQTQNWVHRVQTSLLGPTERLDTHNTYLIPKVSFAAAYLSSQQK